MIKIKEFKEKKQKIKEKDQELFYGVQTMIKFA